jgi:chromosome segregation ATPase
MTMRLQAIAVVLLLGACTTSTDPGEGGFIAGVQGLTTGAYDARIDTAEAEVAEAQARNDALRAEQAGLAAQIAAGERDLASARFRLLNQRDAATLDDATAARVNATLTAQPQGATEAERLADLQRLLSETNALSAELASLGA